MSVKRAKGWGYELERLFLGLLKAIFPRLEREGSRAYHRNAADLVQKPWTSEWANEPPIYIVATKDKGRHKPPLVTLTVADLQRLLGMSEPERRRVRVRVQVKGRSQTWIGGLYEKLRQAR